MKKHSKAVSRKTEKPENTVGIDIGDKFSRYCVLNPDGDVIEEGRMKTEAGAFRRHFAGAEGMRIAMECGTHSPWISRLLEELGQEVMVANARRIEAIRGAVPIRRAAPEYGSAMLVRRVQPQGWFSFKHDYVFVSETLAGEAVGLEAIDERYYRIYLARFPIATFGSHKRHVEPLRKTNQY